MLVALIEQRMCNDDRKVWARHLENSRQEATLAQLITWMTTEMKSRMRATTQPTTQASGEPRWRNRNEGSKSLQMLVLSEF